MSSTCDWSSALQCFKWSDATKTSNRLSETVTRNCWQLTLVCVSAVSTSIFPCEAVRATSFFCSWPSTWWHCSRAESNWSESWWSRKGRGGKGGGGSLMKILFPFASQSTGEHSTPQKYRYLWCTNGWWEQTELCLWCQHTWEFLALAASSFCSLSLAFSCMDRYAPSSFSWRDLCRNN